MKIKTFIINLPERCDRLKHAQKQFEKRKLFDCVYYPAIKHHKGSVGLWKSVVECVKEAKNFDEEFILICEDDHSFTKNYSNKILKDYIQKSITIQTDILLGGVSFFQSPVKKSSGLYWVERFTGTQFMIIFRKFYDKIINADFGENDDADFKIQELTQSYLVIFPFISTQKNFGYSDVTAANAGTRVKRLFATSKDLVSNLLYVEKHYQSLANIPIDENFNEITIPTYVINLPSRKDRLKHIRKQFEGRDEFDLIIFKAIHHQIGALGLWLTIRKIIQEAIIQKHDVIIIVEDDHTFTASYNKELLIKNIIGGYNQGADYISGGIGNFRNALKVGADRFWVDFCQSAQFIIVYRDFFNDILNAPFDNNVIADLKLSELSVNKQVIFPFISQQKDFGYSDVTPAHNDTPGLIQQMFMQSEKRLLNISKHYEY